MEKAKQGAPAAHEPKTEAWCLHGEQSHPCALPALDVSRAEVMVLRAALDRIRRGAGGIDPLGRMEMARIATAALEASNG